MVCQSRFVDRHIVNANDVCDFWKVTIRNTRKIKHTKWKEKTKYERNRQKKKEERSKCGIGCAALLLLLAATIYSSIGICVRLTCVRAVSRFFFRFVVVAACAGIFFFISYSLPLWTSILNELREWRNMQKKDALRCVRRSWKKTHIHMRRMCGCTFVQNWSENWKGIE